MDDRRNYENLANAIIGQAVKDYRRAWKILRANPRDRISRICIKEVEDFFLSDWFTVLTAYNGRDLLQFLKKETAA